MASVDGRVSSKKVGELKYLLKITNRLYPTGCHPFSLTGKQTKSAFILTVKVYRFKLLFFFSDDLLTDLRKVFLKASTLFASFLMCDLRAVFILALNFLTTNP